MDNNLIFVPIFNVVKEIFFDDEDKDESNITEKIENFAEITVPNFHDNQFKKHFRLTAATFEDLLGKVYSVSNTRGVGFPRTELDKEVMVTIWYLGNIESFRSVANRFGLTKATCWAILIRTCFALIRVNDRYKIITWPDRDRQRDISQNFGANGFPGIIGCIDGSHIRIVAPKNNAISYINRKGFHSLLLQAICDDKMLFTDVYIGEVGSLHDFTVYKKSPIYRAIQNGDVQFFNDSHLIGDLAYKLETNLIIAFKDFGRLTDRQKKFNKVLSKARVKIENSLALLKGRFRRLKFLETVREDLCVLNIMGACILHNVCILHGDTFDDILNLEEERMIGQQNEPDNLEDIDDGQMRNQAIAKRNNILNVLPIINN